MLWFTSDLHLGHENILRFAHRPWDTVAQMDEALIANINETVAPGDTLYILGDVAYRGSREHAAELLRRIDCRHVRLLKGNHDGDWGDAGVFERIDDYLEVKYHGRRLCMIHYPLMTWNGIYYGSFHLHGHIHSEGAQYNEKNRAQGYFRYDVGVDANGYRPVSYDAIAAFYKDVEPVTPYRDNECVGVERRPEPPRE